MCVYENKPNHITTCRKALLLHSQRGTSDPIIIKLKQLLKTKWEIYAVAPRAKGTSVALGAMAMLGIR